MQVQGKVDPRPITGFLGDSCGRDDVSMGNAVLSAWWCARACADASVLVIEWPQLRISGDFFFLLP